ncbi:MAG: Na+/H+ antiporter subunit E [Deltaproteobacteria bacterium]|nr:Na+/H+ antiporter subunit E [Deltaproteobacteria bacterium]
MKAKFATFIIMLSFWVILSGMFDAFHLTLGVISCLLVAQFSGKMLFEGLKVEVRVKQIFGMLAYGPWLLWAIVLSSLEVAYIVLHPRMLEKMDPQLIRFKTKLKSNFARVTFAQSITLTPGTITVSVHDDEMTVYALTQNAANSLPGEMERRIARALEPEGA